MEKNELRTEIKKLVLKLREESTEKIIPIEASGRHVHLSQKAVEKSCQQNPF